MLCSVCFCSTSNNKVFFFARYFLLAIHPKNGATPQGGTHDKNELGGSRPVGLTLEELVSSLHEYRSKQSDQSQELSVVDQALPLTQASREIHLLAQE